MFSKWVESFWLDPWEHKSSGSVCRKTCMRGMFMIYPEPCYLHFRHKQILSIQINRVSLFKKKTRIQSAHVKVWIWGFSWVNGKKAWPVFLRGLCSREQPELQLRRGCAWAQAAQGPYCPTPSGPCGAMCCWSRSMLQRDELARSAEPGARQRSLPQGKGWVFSHHSWLISLITTLRATAGPAQFAGC